MRVARVGLCDGSPRLALCVCPKDEEEGGDEIEGKVRDGSRPWGIVCVCPKDEDQWISISVIYLL